MGGDFIRNKNHQFISGFHGVRESLVNGRAEILELWIAQGRKTARTAEILRIAGEQNIPVHFKPASELSRLLPDTAHQGIVALARKFEYANIDRVINDSLKNESRALLIAADHITDEGNLGALVRTGAFFGADGLIIPKDRSAGVTTNVLKRSCGAHAYLPIARVVNIGRTLDILKKKDFWIIGASGEGIESVYRFDWTRKVVLVMGNEQKGLSRSVLQLCDQVVSISPAGSIDSLNVVVAAGVIMSEINRQRGLARDSHGHI